MDTDSEWATLPCDQELATLSTLTYLLSVNSVGHMQHSMNLTAQTHPELFDGEPQINASRSTISYQAMSVCGSVCTTGNTQPFRLRKPMTGSTEQGFLSTSPHLFSSKHDF